MFVYCMDVLHLSEAEAYLRLTAARAARDTPCSSRCSRTVGSISPASPSSRPTSHQRTGTSSSLAPSTDPSGRSRSWSPSWLPGPTFRVCCVSCRAGRLLRIKGAGRRYGSTHSGPSRVLSRSLFLLVASASSRRPDAVPPPAPHSCSLLAARSRQIQSPVHRRCRATRQLLRLRALLRSEVPDGDLAAIFEKAVTEKLERLEARRFGRTSSPRKSPARVCPDPSSRHIPAAVRRAVHRRDGGRCCFVDARGRRCSERHRLEYHHRHPFGLGGGHDPDNICLMCRTHNRYLAEVDYGTKALARHRGPARETGRTLELAWEATPREPEKQLGRDAPGASS